MESMPRDLPERVEGSVQDSSLLGICERIYDILRRSWVSFCRHVA